MVLRPDLPAVVSPRFSFGASVSLAVTLREMFGVDARLKWPNDVLIGGRKVAGILSEMEAEADLITFLNIGVGLNVNNAPPAGMGEAVSLAEILGRHVSRRDILSGFLDRFETCVQAERLARVMTDWKTLALTLERPVRIDTPQGGVGGGSRWTWMKTAPCWCGNRTDPSPASFAGIAAMHETARER